VSADLATRLEAAIALAREADELVMRHFQRLSAGQIDRKRDGSLVTVADREAERLVREGVAKRFPQDSVLGEEFGETGAAVDGAGGSGDLPHYRWIIDPIDGTASFVHGVPLFGTLIGVERAGEPVVGVIHMPALHETVHAARGGGAWWTRGGEAPVRARMRPCASLKDAMVLTTSPDYFRATSTMDALLRLAAAAGAVRGWSDCYAHLLLATGRADVAVEPKVHVWDVAPMGVVMPEAGGVHTDWAGTPTIHSSRSLAASAPLVHELVDVLAGTRR
jgi:histidinol phosphatase-like enzyme (inositol monophosphatase family)